MEEDDAKLLCIHCVRLLGAKKMLGPLGDGVGCRQRLEDGFAEDDIADDAVVHFQQVF